MVYRAVSSCVSKRKDCEILLCGKDEVPVFSFDRNASQERRMLQLAIHQTTTVTAVAPILHQCQSLSIIGSGTKKSLFVSLVRQKTLVDVHSRQAPMRKASTVGLDRLGVDRLGVDLVVVAITLIGSDSLSIRLFRFLFYRKIVFFSKRQAMQTRKASNGIEFAL